PDHRVERLNLTARRLMSGGYGNVNTVAQTPPALEEPIVAPVFLETNGMSMPMHEQPDIIAFNGVAISQRQLLLETTSGPPVPVFVQAAPLFDADGTVARTVVVFQDMTRLREAEQLKDDFLSLVSHEFRTPLTAIHGGASLLESHRDELDAETQQELLVDISRESGRLDQMLSNMLRLAEVMAGRLQAESEPVLLGPLIQRVSRSMKDRFPDASFILELPSELPAVEADASLLQQVIWNLYENAVKYTSGEKRIVTSANVEAGNVEVHIRDNGMGIAAEHVHSVFERFRRPGADPSIRGMGLGLYLCQLLMVAQEGSIRGESAGVGMGATFSFTLPIATGWGDED
ncbi:MAG: ATP-binding protein, partial [Thermomicrobiales bacterium]